MYSPGNSKVIKKKKKKEKKVNSVEINTLCAGRFEYACTILIKVHIFFLSDIFLYCPRS